MWTKKHCSWRRFYLFPASCRIALKFCRSCWRAGPKPTHVWNNSGHVRKASRICYSFLLLWCREGSWRKEARFTGPSHSIGHHNMPLIIKLIQTSHLYYCFNAYLSEVGTNRPEDSKGGKVMVENGKEEVDWVIIFCGCQNCKKGWYQVPAVKMRGWTILK